MNNIDRIIETYPDSKFLIADDFDDAIIGVDEKSNRVIYSITKCLNILVKKDNMCYTEAYEYFEFNVSGAYVGENTPIWCDDIIFN